MSFADWADQRGYMGNVSIRGAQMMTEGEWDVRVLQLVDTRLFQLDKECEADQQRSWNANGRSGIISWNPPLHIAVETADLTALRRCANRNAQPMPRTFLS